MKFYGRDRGSTIMGTEGTALIDRGGYEIYDLKGNKKSEVKAGIAASVADLIGRDSMTDAHFANFIAGIRKGEKLNAPINVGNISDIDRRVELLTFADSSNEVGEVRVGHGIATNQIGN